MNLLIAFDHRFFRARDGLIFSEKAYSYKFFSSRYLKVFEKVRIIARVEDVNVLTAPRESVAGPGLEIVQLPNWRGFFGFVRHRNLIKKLALSSLKEQSSVIVIGPGGIGSVLLRELEKNRYPYGLEVISDPWEAFQAGGVKHSLRPILRRWLRSSLGKQCADACAVSYVTNHALQSRYPCSGFSTGISDVVLPKSAFVMTARRFDSCRTIISVAVMSNWYKGHDILLDALSICAKAGTPPRLVLVGDGSLRGSIESLARKKGLHSLVRFTGQLSPGDAVQRELDAADLFVMPSRTEGMPRALIEAMARALPCVASNVGGIPELLDSDSLVPPGDSESLARKIMALVATPSQLDALSRRNLGKAHEYEDSVLSVKRNEFYERVRTTTEEFLSARNRVKPPKRITD